MKIQSNRKAKEKNGSTEFLSIVNQPKCRWTEFTNRETEGGQILKDSTNILPLGHTQQL